MASSRNAAAYLAAVGSMKAAAEGGGGGIYQRWLSKPYSGGYHQSASANDSAAGAHEMRKRSS